jgi:hypothetical protein
MACGDRKGAALRFNTKDSAFEIETELFVGKMYMRFRGLSGEPTEYFKGKQRMLSAVVQGRVKSTLVMADCMTGYEFDEPFKNLPAKWLIASSLRLARKLAPTLAEDVLGQRPYVLNPLFQTIQLLNVALPGEEPSITGHLSESTRLLGGIFAQRSLDRLERKKYFASAKNGARHMLTPEHVYTMEFYEDKVRFRAMAGGSMRHSSALPLSVLAIPLRPACSCRVLRAYPT